MRATVATSALLLAIAATGAHSGDGIERLAVGVPVHELQTDTDGNAYLRSDGVLYAVGDELVALTEADATTSSFAVHGPERLCAVRGDVVVAPLRTPALPLLRVALDEAQLGYTADGGLFIHGRRSDSEWTVLRCTIDGVAEIVSLPEPIVDAVATPLGLVVATADAVALVRRDGGVEAVLEPRELADDESVRCLAALDTGGVLIGTTARTVRRTTYGELRTVLDRGLEDVVVTGGALLGLPTHGAETLLRVQMEHETAADVSRRSEAWSELLRGRQLLELDEPRHALAALQRSHELNASDDAKALLARARAALASQEATAPPASILGRLSQRGFPERLLAAVEAEALGGRWHVGPTRLPSLQAQYEPPYGPVVAPPPALDLARRETPDDCPDHLRDAASRSVRLGDDIVALLLAPGRTELRPPNTQTDVPRHEAPALDPVPPFEGETWSARVHDGEAGVRLAVPVAWSPVADRGEEGLLLVRRDAAAPSTVAATWIDLDPRTPLSSATSAIAARLGLGDGGGAFVAGAEAPSYEWLSRGALLGVSATLCLSVRRHGRRALVLALTSPAEAPSAARREFEMMRQTASFVGSAEAVLDVAEAGGPARLVSVRVTSGGNGGIATVVRGADAIDVAGDAARALGSGLRVGDRIPREMASSEGLGPTRVFALTDAAGERQGRVAVVWGPGFALGAAVDETRAGPMALPLLLATLYVDPVRPGEEPTDADTLFREASRASRAGDLDRTIDLLGRVEPAGARGGLRHLNLARVHYRRGELALAEEHAGIYLELADTDERRAAGRELAARIARRQELARAAAYWPRFDAATRAGSPDETRARLHALLDENPPRPILRAIGARLAKLEAAERRTARYDDIAARIDAAGERLLEAASPDFVFELVDEITSLAAEDASPRALVEYRALLIRLVLVQREAEYRLAALHHRTGNPHEAAAALEHLRERGVRNAELEYDLAQSLRSAGRLDEAAEALERFAADAPPDARRTLEILSGNMRRRGEAIPTFNAAVRAYKAKDVDRALALLDRTLEVDPKFARAYQTRAVVGRMGDPDRAVSDARRAVELDGTRTRYWKTLATLLGALKKHAEAAAAYHAAYARDGAATTLFKAAQHEWAAGDEKTATRHMREAVDLEPGKASVFENLLGALGGRGR